MYMTLYVTPACALVLQLHAIYYNVPQDKKEGKVKLTRNCWKCLMRLKRGLKTVKEHGKKSD